MENKIPPAQKGELSYRLLEESPYMVFWVLPSGRFAYTNAATQQALGYSAEELSQLRASDVLANYGPEERVELREEIANRGDGLLRAVLVRKDKSTIPVESSNHLFEFEGEPINCAICRRVSPPNVSPTETSPGSGSSDGDANDMRSLYEMADSLNIIGSSRAMRAILLYARRFASRSELPVLITGETGVGKESLARFVHENSARAEKKFVCVNCASFVENDMISRLFGHVRGAFTGAVKDRKGIFESARGGTLFMDEIGELSLNAQKQLLRVLQSGSYYRMGDDRERKTDIRLIAATNQNLPEMVREGTFREDLYFRICVLHLHLPPLRERISDVPQLVEHKLKQITKKTRLIVKKPTKTDMKLLMGYGYPGNVRELFNIIDRAFVLNDGGTLKIKPEHFVTVYAGGTGNAGTTGTGIPTLKEVQVAHIIIALKRCRWKVNGKGGAAELLDINPNTLRARMNKYDIQRPKPER